MTKTELAQSMAKFLGWEQEMMKPSPMLNKDEDNQFQEWFEENIVDFIFEGEMTMEELIFNPYGFMAIQNQLVKMEIGFSMNWN